MMSISTFPPPQAPSTPSTPFSSREAARSHPEPSGTALSVLLSQSSVAAELFARWQHNQYAWVLPLATRRRLAVALAAFYGCSRSVAAHRLRASACGLTGAELDANQQGSSQDARAERALEFALAIAARRGCVEPAQWQRIHKAGFAEAELIEIIALVGANLLEHYLGASLHPEASQLHQKSQHPGMP